MTQLQEYQKMTSMRRDLKKGQDRTLLAEKVYDEFNGADGVATLPVLCTALLTDQKKTWPLLRNGYESLRQVRERNLPCTGFSVLLQHNHGRIKSTLAAVGEQDTNKRPCFLCLRHLPEGQKGVLYRGEYLILCNPMPVFSGHFTIAHIDHRPQIISGHIDTLLQLMADFGSGWTTLYNGPRCGASAPDHFHFQAVPSGRMPIEAELREKERLRLIAQKDGVVFYRAKDVGREVIILEGDTSKAVGNAFTGFLNALKKGLWIESRRQGRGTLSSEHGEREGEAPAALPLEGATRAPLMHEEPMINVAGLYEQAKWRLVVFPRHKHRPDAFFKIGAARVAVSPAVIEMGGVLVTPFARDFERLDAAAVESIYEEVSLEGKSVESVIDAI